MIYQQFLKITIALAFCIFAISPAVLADESCSIKTPETDVGAPPLCKGRSIDALLSAETEEPDFGGVNDILQGVRTIFPAEDLIVMNPNSRLPNGPQTALIRIRDFFFFTEDEQVTQYVEPLPIAVTECNTNGGGDTPDWLYGAPSPQQTNSVRMFNLDRDVVVTYSIRSSSSNCALSGLVVATQDPLGVVFVPSLFPTGLYNKLPFFLQSAVGDFNGDGYEDILIIRGGADSGMFIITARDPNVPGNGLKVGPYVAFPISDQAYSAMNAMSSPAIGDFNGDSITDVAWVGSRASNNTAYNIFFASICPGSTPNIALCDGKSEFQIVLDPLSSKTIALDTFVDANAEWVYPASALAAGDFNTNPDQSAGDDLIVVYGQAGVNGWDLEYYTFDSSMNPTLRDSESATTFKIFNAYAESAQFDITQPGEQAVIALQPFLHCPLWVVSFNAQGMIRHVSDWVGSTSGNGNCSAAHYNPSRISLNGMAVGRFTGEAPSTAEDLVPQIAVYLANYTTESLDDFRIRILDAKPENDFIAKYVSSFSGTNSNLTSYFSAANPNRGGSFLRTGDLQGRSAVLGTPDVARVSNWLQVNTIIGAPPMHTAYIQGINQSEPVVNNFSVSPPTFTTSFTTGTNTATTLTQTDKTSWTFSFEQSLEITEKWQAVPILGGINFQTNISASANETYDCNVETVSNSYISSENVISTNTGFGDNIIYTESRKNIYFYPVIGQTVCPDGTDDCLESEREPLYYQISAPDQICTNLVPGRTSEFYQPPHQPGNIFTYPASRNQLLDRFSSDQSNILSEPTLGFLTNNSSFTQIKKWNQGEGSECTAGTTETISGKQSISFVFGAGILDNFTAAGLKETVKFDFGQSRAISSNESSTSMTSDSIGIEVEKPNEFLNPDEYQYLINSYILGQPFPEGVWQSLFDGPAPDNIDSAGPLIVAFTSNMLSNDSGSWWESGGINAYLQFPDIGLNFPERWRDVPVKTGNLSEQPPDCRLEKFNADKLSCTFMKKPAETPGELWSSGFYHIRGFFIQAGAEAIGPSQSYVYIGDDINLSSRVYNVSLKSMDSTDLVKVQFYRQQWDNTLNIPIGDSILISEETIAAIPPFTASDNPNWKLVTTSLNTEEADMGPGKYWVFWVLAYAVDQNGDLVQELPGYGLDDSPIGGFKPGDVFTSILDVPLKKVTVKEIGADVIRSFTNNVGFYKHAVYVAAQPSNLDDELEPIIIIDNISVTPSEVLVGEEVLVKADIVSLDSDADGVMVHFYPRHPDESEMPFDAEMLSHIEKDGLHNVQVVFQPEFCGEHDLHIAAGNNGECNLAADIQSVNLNVICEPGDTNLDGELIGPDGQPGLSGNSDTGCSLASINSRAEIPFYLIVPLIVVALRFGFRKIRLSK
jgi:hypothetical protein